MGERKGGRKGGGLSLGEERREGSEIEKRGGLVLAEMADGGGSGEEEEEEEDWEEAKLWLCV